MPSTAPTGPASRPAVIRSAAAVHAVSSATSSSRDSVTTSKATMCRRSCAAVVMPAWCSPWKGTTSSAGTADADAVRADAMPAAALATARLPISPSAERLLIPSVVAVIGRRPR